MKMMKKMKRLAAIVLCVITLAVSMSPAVHAANAGSGVKGSSRSAVTFTVETGKTATGSRLFGNYGNSITITPKNGKANVENKFTGKKSTTSAYCQYWINVTSLKTGNTVRYIMNNKDVKIQLSPNQKYKITVTPKTDWIFWQYSVANFWYYNSWNKHATWSVSKTVGVNYCR